MNIAAAIHCYDFARQSGNPIGAVRHLRRIRAELRFQRARRSITNKKQISSCAQDHFVDAAEMVNTDRVQSIFDHQ